MTIETWLLDRIKPYERNPRKIPQRAIDKVAASLLEFGWQQPIVVNKAGVIIVGHTRYLAARKLGWTEAPVHVGANLTAAQEKAYRLMDNRSHEEATWSLSAIETELSELSVMNFDLKLTGFGDGEGAFSLPPLPDSVATNIEEMKVIRASGRKKVVVAADTERYLIIVFPTRQEREEALSVLGFPPDERYLTSNAVSLRLIGPSKLHGSAAPANKAGATG